jgi:hypothetical protein
VSAGRVVSQKSEGKLVRGLLEDGRRSGFRSRGHSRVCGEESLGDRGSYAEAKVSGGLPRKRQERQRFGRTEVRSEDNATVPLLDPPKQVGAVKPLTRWSARRASDGAMPATDRNVGARL